MTIERQFARVRGRHSLVYVPRHDGVRSALYLIEHAFWLQVRGVR